MPFYFHLEHKYGKNAGQICIHSSSTSPSNSLRLPLHRLAVLADKMLLRLDRALAHTRRDHPANTRLERRCDRGVHLGRSRRARRRTSLPAVNTSTQNAGERAQHNTGVLLQVVDDSVRACVKGVCGNGPAGLGVDGLDSAHSGTRNVVHVVDGRVGVGTGGVERVGVAHGDLGESSKVLGGNGLFHLGHVVRDHSADAFLEEARRGDGLLHARRGRDALLGRRHDQNNSAHLGPGGRGCDLLSQRVGAVLLLAHAPGDVAAKDTAACRARALAGNQGQLGRRVGQLVQVGNGAHEGSEAGSRRGEAGGGGEVVLGDDAQGQAGELGERRVGGLKGRAALAQGTEAGLGSGARDVRGLAVEEEAVALALESSRAGGRGQSAEVGLGEGDGERRVGGEVELGVTLAPVPRDNACGQQVDEKTTSSRHRIER